MKKIVIHVEGGLVQDVYVSDELTETEVVILDFDNLEAEGLPRELREGRLEEETLGMLAVVTV